MGTVFVFMTFTWTDLPELSQARPDFVTFVSTGPVEPVWRVEP